MSGERDGIQEQRVSEAVTTLNGRGIVMVPETAEHGEHLEEEEESVIVPTTVPAFVNSKAEDCQPYTDDNVSRCGNSVDRTVGEQLPDIIQSSYSVNEGIPSAGCESHHKKVSPEEPRSLESTNLCPDNLSSPCLGDEIDVNNISENNTSELESSDSSQKSENVGKKRKLSTEEIDSQERKVSKRTRTVDVVTDGVDYSCYNDLMQQIREQNLSKSLELSMFGVKFRALLKLELESKSDYPKLIEALNRGVQKDAEADETNVGMFTICEDNSSTDHTKITNCSEAGKLEINENISSTVTLGTSIADIDTNIADIDTNKESHQNFQSITDREKEETNKQEKCISSDVNETRHSGKTMINERRSELDNNSKETDKSNKNIEDTWNLTEARQAVKPSNRYDRDKERYSIIRNIQYSDISEDEDDSPILNLSRKTVTGNVDSSHIDTPPPRFHHPEVYYNTKAKGGTSCNPVIHSNEIKEADVTKLPNFEYIESENSQNEQKLTSHEEVIQKLNKKLIMKIKSEGKYAPKEQSSVLRMVEQVKIEVPDHFVPAIEEVDPDATLHNGFGGSGGMIVKDEIADYSNMPSD